MNNYGRDFSMNTAMNAAGHSNDFARNTSRLLVGQTISIPNPPLLNRNISQAVPSKINPFVHTPFGLLPTYVAPEPKNFNFDATKGYYHDSTTGFFYDRNSDYYYNPKSNKWMFWCSKFNTYIDCAGGDLDLKKRLQEEEFNLQQKQTTENTSNTIIPSPGSLTVQRRSEDISDDWFDLIKRVRAGSLTKPTPVVDIRPTSVAKKLDDAEREEKNKKELITSNAQASLRECIIQNEKFLFDLHKLLAQERDPIAIEKIKSQIDGFNSTTRSLETLLAMLSNNEDNSSTMKQKSNSSSSTNMPQLKRHITKNDTNNNNEQNSFLNSSPGTSLTHSANQFNENSRRNDLKRTEKPNNSLRESILEGKRTAFDEHIEQVERLRRAIRDDTNLPKGNWFESKLNIFPKNELSFENQVRTMVDQQVEKQWLFNSSNSNNSTHYQHRSRSPTKKNSNRSRSRSRRSKSKSRRQRSRSRSRNRSGRSRSRHRGNGERSYYNEKDDDDLEIIEHKLHRKDRSNSPQPPPVVPMVISPPPTGFVIHRSGEPPASTLFDRMGNQRRMEESSMIQRQYEQVNHSNMKSSDSFYSNWGNNKQGSSSFPAPYSSNIESHARHNLPQSGGASMQAPIVGQSQYLSSSYDPLKMSPYQTMGGRSSAASNPLSLPIICDYCGADGHLRDVCPTLPKVTLTQDQKNIRNELDYTKTLRNIDADVAPGLCLNCGRYGHNQIGCLLPRISDSELQKKIRKAEERKRIQELDKLKIKQKAEKYTVKRNDPFIQRLRAIAPHGKITKEHVRLLCQRCSGLGHVWNECARDDECTRPMLKLITDKKEEFIKVFFVHLNEDNLVDFSEKFDIFTIMDGIENAGTMDPVGLQLQERCHRGIVTKVDLRDLCSKCASLGHGPSDCTQKTSCSKQHYDKMLKLVEAYRALVKEGNGNFFLPRLDQPFNMNINSSSNQTTKHSNSDEILLVDSDDDYSSDKRKKRHRKR